MRPGQTTPKDTMTTTLGTPPMTFARVWAPMAALVAGCALAFAAAGPASAAPDNLSATGESGQKLTVTQSADLDPSGTDVTVSGTGFDKSKGIYVAIAVNKGPGKRATPVIGGVDTTGGSGANMWISSNPPGYGKDLAVPFGPGGSFEFDLTIVAKDAITDCLDPAIAPKGCVLAAYMDHTRLADRSADVSIPLTFAKPGTTAADPTEPSSSAAAPPSGEATNPEEAETTATASATATAEATEATEATEAETTASTPAASQSTTPAPTTTESTPPTFWLWIALAGLGVIATTFVIRNTMNRVRAREVAEAEATAAAASAGPRGTPARGTSAPDTPAGEPPTTDRPTGSLDE